MTIPAQRFSLDPDAAQPQQVDLPADLAELELTVDDDTLAITAATDSDVVPASVFCTDVPQPMPPGWTRLGVVAVRDDTRDDGHRAVHVFIYRQEALT